jgi:bacillithiol system protein YtxJ
LIDNLLKRLKRKNIPGNNHAIPVLSSATDLDELMSQELVILFKHSNSCPVSWAAHAQVTKFARENPEILVYMIPVIKERPLSQKVAAVTGVGHQSPQVIVLREGIVAAAASHADITVEGLSEMLDAYPAK